MTVKHIQGVPVLQHYKERVPPTPHNSDTLSKSKNPVLFSNINFYQITIKLR